MKNPLIPKKEHKKFIDLPKSAGILDDYAVRKNVATREGTIEKVPINNSDIVNKKYCDDNQTDWTVSQSPAVIHADNYTNTTYTSSNFTHNDLTGLQGGSSTERYHLTLANANRVPTSLIGDGASTRIPYYTATRTLGSVTTFVYDSINGRVGIGTTSPTERLQANGRIKGVGYVPDQKAHTDAGMTSGDWYTLLDKLVPDIGNIAMITGAVFSSELREVVIVSYFERIAIDELTLYGLSSSGAIVSLQLLDRDGTTITDTASVSA